MMKAPQIDSFRFHYRGQEYTLDKNSRTLLDRLYALLSAIAPCGEDERRTIWIRADRGTADDYGDYEMQLEDGEVTDRKEFEKNWLEDYPDEYYYYKLTTVQYRDWRTVVLNGETVIRINPEKTDPWGHDVSELLEWMISEVENVLDMLKRGVYNSYIREILPYKYRKGVITTKEYWKLYPEEEKEHYEKLSREECAELSKLLAEANDEDQYKPAGRIKQMTVNKYLWLSKIGYDANRLDGYETLSPLEMYKRYADGRDGGLLEIEPDSPEAFDSWFEIPDKWVIENPSHLWEAISGGSRTRMLFSVRKDEEGYYLTLSQNEYCCPQEAVRFYIALRKNNIPVYFYDAALIEKYLSGNGKTGVVPCYNEPWQYFYGGFKDKDVGEFINLPDEPCDELIKAVTWEEIPEVKLKEKEVSE